MKPFLKWVGGKTQILDAVLGAFPSEINDYHEIFVGGGSVLLAALEKANVKGKFYAYDLNKILIDTYKDIQTRPKELQKEVDELFRVYDSINGTEINRKPTDEQEALTSQESYYYWVRHLYNTGTQ